MESSIRNEKEQRGTERLVLAIFSIYGIIMSVGAFRNNWQYWIPFLMLFGMFTAWFLVAREYKTFLLRSTIVTLIMEVSLLLYAVNSDYQDMLPTFFVLTLLIALYGVPDYMYITMVVISFITAYDLLFGAGIQGNFTDAKIMQQIGNVVFFEVLLTFWVRKRQQSVGQTSNMIQALKRAERSKDDFMANVSHEIRTPLNSIMGVSEIILNEQNLDTIKDEVYQIQLASRNLLSTVSDILDFSELQAGDITIDEEAYNISSTVNNVVNIAVAQKAEKNIELIINMDPNIPKLLYGDEKKIRRVVMNLVNNAIKFTESGYVGVKISARQESYGVNLCFTISDSGIGMREENIEKLFTSFSQVDAKRNRQEGGLGLGLAISKAIAEKLGGVITVHSIPGKGSTITFVVPQKVVDAEPSIVVENASDLNVLCYINMEQFALPEIRDAYQENIEGMIHQIGVNCYSCRNLDELKRRIKLTDYDFIFISWVEYLENTEFFDSLTDRIQIVVIVDRAKETLIKNEKVIRLYKPCYTLPLSILAKRGAVDTKDQRRNSFIAPKAHLLVVDDNLMNIRVVEGLLSRYQIKVTRALSGAEALEKIESQDYDFVFMDHMMPEMDGIETAKRIRAKMGSYYEHVPIIALTANAVAGSREMFLKEGFADFIEKPVEVSVLERLLRRNLLQEKIIEIDAEELHEQKEQVIELQNVSEMKEADNESEAEIEIIINTDAGAMYCGTEEIYYEILVEYCENYRETRDRLNHLFDKQDWKNYTIMIHALKSSMRNIGADQCADLAYELEMAGKNEQYEVILNKHSVVMELFRRTMLKVVSFEQVKAGNELIEDTSTKVDIAIEEDLSGLIALEKEEIQVMLDAFENAMYSLDKEQMVTILERLEACQYENVALKPKLEKIHKKVNQEDYFAAGDILQDLWSKLTQKGGV